MEGSGPSSGGDSSDKLLAQEDSKRKRKTIALTGEGTVQRGDEPPVAALGEDLLFEVLRHVDGRTLARAACVSRIWRRTAEDERLWEIMCTREWRYGVPNLRSMVLAQGGFRRLHSRFVAPFTRPSSSSSSRSSSSSLVSILPSSPHVTINSSTPSAFHPVPQTTSSDTFTSTAPPRPPGPSPSAPRARRLGRDEVLLSLSLFSSQFYFENMGIKKFMDRNNGDGGSNGDGGNSSGGL